VDKIENGEFIGFIGLSRQTFEADFTPIIDIGWRLMSNKWGKGFATEGAQRCLKYATTELKIETVYAIVPKVNAKSVGIMSKIGMIKVKEFDHPLLANDDRLKTCVLYCYVAE
jgi:RimJ/RimL family protein N-acetyltransferase